jgi:Tfp pilus assembly protein PilX
MNRRQPRHEEGSAYLVTLLLLIVLTLMGLSLALVTSTESQIGANERILERVFYTSDAGVGIAAARILVSSDYYYDIADDT